MPDRLMRRGWEVQAERRRQRRRRPLVLARIITAILLLITLAAAAYALLRTAGIGQFPTTASTNTVSTSSSAMRVIDGDTVWFKGQRLRLLVIDAPEIHSPRCEAELDVGLKAKDELAHFIDHRLVDVKFSGRSDVFGRPLVKLSVNGRDAGEHLLSKKLAIRYAWGKTFAKVYWCGPW